MTKAEINELDRLMFTEYPDIITVEQLLAIRQYSLRQRYAAEKYRELMDSGRSQLEAHFAVSLLMGHTWADVPDIYLASA